MKTIAYIDAFNLYFGSLKGTPFKWVNLEKLLDLRFPNNQITEIKYFTARVKPIRGATGTGERQDLYLDALSTLRRVEVIEGHYLVKNKRARLTTPLPDGTEEVTIIKAEEKQSDVNLASHLVRDALLNRMEAAIVVSGDGDVSTPIVMARETGIPVVVLNPQKRLSWHLRQVASQYCGTHYKNGQRIHNNGLRVGILRDSQFPDTVLLPDGTFVEKPKDWA